MGASSDNRIDLLKKLLRAEVSSFYRQRTNSAVHVLDAVRERGWDAVFFGGTLRSLLVSRLSKNQLGKPRDLDVVVLGVTIDELSSLFGGPSSRRTRFGGLHFRRANWQFDIWPLEDTFALRQGGVVQPTFEDLPATTFLNVEAIAVEVWPKSGSRRQLFAHDDQFFQAILDRTIEINQESNPFPALCVVRSLVMAANLEWKIGPRLLRYLAKHGHDLSRSDFEEIQQKHYGRVHWPGRFFQSAMTEVKMVANDDLDRPTMLALPVQLSLWPETDYLSRIEIRAMRRLAPPATGRKHQRNVPR